MERTKKGATSHKNGNGGKHWTDEEVKKYLEMKDKGYTCKKISDFLPGRTERACQQFGKNGHTNGHKNGNGGKHWTDEQIALASKLLTEGKNYKEISKALLKKFGINKNPGAVRAKMWRMQIWTDEEKKNLARLEIMGLTIFEIAEILHKNTESVVKKIESLKENKEWDKLVKEVIEEDKVFENEIQDVKPNTNEKLKL